MTTYTFDEQIISDLHKDARGFRPTKSWWIDWQDATPAEKQAIWDHLCDEHENAMREETERKDLALRDMQRRIAELRALGAGDDQTAIRWIIEGEEFDEYDLAYGADFFCYHFGLAFGVDLPIQAAINELTARVA